jgi:2'-5' RNA ligase superfamily
MFEAASPFAKLKMHAIVSLLDEKNDRTVRSLSDELEKTFGVHAQFRTPDPHFSYQGATNYSLPRLERRLDRFARRSRRFRVHAGGLGLFTGFTPVLYIPVVRTPELSKFHLSLWRTVSSTGSGISPYYKPESWVPHITLAQGGIDQRTLPKVMGKLCRKELELDITVDNLAIIFFDGEKHALRSRFQLE